MQISVQTGGVIPFWGFEEGYRMIKEAGFDGIDWNIDNVWDRDDLKAQLENNQLKHCIFEDSLEDIMAYYQEELDVIHKYGLNLIQAHAPFPAYIEGFPEFNEYAIRVYRNCIRFCAKAGIKYLVIHGASLRLNDYTQTPQTIREMNRHLYESLIPELKETDVVVCLENLFTRYKGNIVEGVCSNPEEAVSYLDELNEKAGKECFAFCLDTGHLNLLGKNQGVFIRSLGSRIKALHIHDNWGDDDDHLAPYTGNIIWKDVVEALKDIRYTGSLNFETFQQVSLNRVDPEAVPVLLKMIYGIGDVFRRNITAGEK